MRILISGVYGKMGKTVRRAVDNTDDVEIICGVDRGDASNEPPFAVYKSFDTVKETPDAIIDFSSPSTLPSLLGFATARNVPAVLCSTGYTASDTERIFEASKKIAVFYTANASLGMYALTGVVKELAAQLRDFDIEIVEEHHSQKADAPGGTALSLVNAIKTVRPQITAVFGRNGTFKKRDKNEIGIHSLRGGNVVGVHTVHFLGDNETITVTHRATDKIIFAEGAITAARFLLGKANGLFGMNDLSEAIYASKGQR